MARKKSITKRRRVLFLDKLEVSGSVTQAAVAGEISRRAWYDLRDRDADFWQLWDDAEAVFMDRVETEAVRRAVFGVNEEKPFTRISENGKKVTDFYTINHRSDRLIELCLKSRHPSYKPVKAIEVTTPDGSMAPARAAVADYSALSDEEIELLTMLQRKAHASDSD
ncbi:MAG: hypothetical protein KAI80_06420 [Hyphomicrobiaceae bacterium]|nr:hypothetical protein [Hyphomicrobiaceae bacterium]